MLPLKFGIYIELAWFFKKNLLFGCPMANFGPFGSLSPAKHLVGFELGTFRFLLQRLNPLGHSPLSFDNGCQEKIVIDS